MEEKRVHEQTIPSYESPRVEDFNERADHHQLHRGLKARHISMIAM
jgi:amino acid permease